MKPRMNFYQAAPDTIKALQRARNPGAGAAASNNR